MNHPETSALAFATARGNRDAAAEFVRATQVSVWRYVAYLADRHVADDLTQETYLRAFGALHSFRGDVDARIWLLAIARRTVADHHRWQRRRSRITAASVPETEPATPDHAEGVALHELVRRLDPDRRTAFVLTQLLGLSYDEAATVSDVPVGTIRSRVARARGELISALDSSREDRPAQRERRERPRQAMT